MHFEEIANSFDEFCDVGDFAADFPVIVQQAYRF